MKTSLYGVVVTHLSEKMIFRAVYRSLRKQPTFCYVTTGFPRNERRNSKLMTCYHPTLGNASDWLIALYTGSNRPFSSCTKPQFRSEAKCETHFHKRGFALSLVLKERIFGNSKMACWLKTKKKKRFCTCSTRFYTFCRHHLVAMRNFLTSRFLEDVNTKRQFPFSFSELGYGRQEFNSRKIRQHLTN